MLRYIYLSQELNFLCFQRIYRWTVLTEAYPPLSSPATGLGKHINLSIAMLNWIFSLSTLAGTARTDVFAVYDRPVLTLIRNQLFRDFRQFLNR
jgi:hypothetical protein